MQALGVIIFFSYGILQFWLGFVGLEDSFGIFWAIASIVIALTLRITLPLTVGTFLAAVEVFDYQLWVGILVAAPGILFIIPSMVAYVLAILFGQRASNNTEVTFDNR